MGTPESRLQGVPLCEPLTGHTGPAVWGVWGSVGGQPVLVTGGDDGTVRLWDPGTGKARGELIGHTGLVRWAAWESSDELPVLATGGDDGTVRLWDPDTGRGLGEALTTLPGSSVFWGMWGSVDGQPVLAAGGDDGTVRVWHFATHLLSKLEGHTDIVRWGEWGILEGRPVLVTGGDDGTARLWDPTTGKMLAQPLRARVPLWWGVWGSLEGRSVLAAGGHDGLVRVLDPVTGEALAELLIVATDSVWWGEWGILEGRPVLATGGGDGTVRLWDPSTGSQSELKGHTNTVRWGLWGSVGDWPVLATGGDDGTVRLWDPAEGRILGEPLTGLPGSTVFWGLWGSVDGRPVLAAGGFDGAVRLWEVVEDRTVARVPLYRSDVTVVADELDRIGDALAVAELITARTAMPPLAVGLFGDWGEGKSHFLGLLQRQVEVTARPGNLVAHSAVRQVRFNAWHYAETDLWASLVAELFAQLSTPADGDRGAEQRRQSRLTAELVAERGLKERLQAARKRSRELQEALREPAGPWDTLSAEQQSELRLLAGDRPEEVYRQAARQVAVLRETGRASWRLVRGVPLGTVARFLAVVIFLVAVAVGVAWGLPSLWRWAAAVPGLASVWAALQLVSRFTEATRIRLNRAWEKAQQFAERQRLRLETAAEVAAAEVTALEKQLQNVTSAGQLAGLVAERAAGTDYRSQLGVMTQIREDFQHMATLLADAAREPTPGQPAPNSHQKPAEAASGRQDQMAGPGRSAREDEARDELPRIDRIILYIDDLDRCPPRRVVEMLEAIHLLLAVELFVVVVAVDPRWLLRAIETHYRDLLNHPEAPAAVSEQTGLVDAEAEELWCSTPAQYLEKIFQVVLTLPPLKVDGYRQLLETLVGARAEHLATRATSPADTAPDSTPAPPAATLPQSGRRQLGNGPIEPLPREPHEVELPPARVVESVDPFTLDPDELALLDLLGPPLLVATPRATKRLANSYGLLTALRREYRQADLAEQHASVLAPDNGQRRDATYVPYRAGMVLLASLIAYPAVGPTFFLNLHDTAARHPDQTWRQYRAALTPRKAQGVWQNAADSDMTPVRAQQWQALLEGLDQVSRQAAAAQLNLPEPLIAWAHWVVPVGRLSFPTGGIVSGLERQRPLPT